MRLGNKVLAGGEWVHQNYYYFIHADKWHVWFWPQSWSSVKTAQTWLFLSSCVWLTVAGSSLAIFLGRLSVQLSASTFLFFLRSFYVQGASASIYSFLSSLLSNLAAFFPSRCDSPILVHPDGGEKSLRQKGELFSLHLNAGFAFLGQELSNNSPRMSSFRVRNDKRSKNQLNWCFFLTCGDKADILNKICINLFYKLLNISDLRGSAAGCFWRSMLSTSSPM